MLVSGYYDMNRGLQCVSSRTADVVLPAYNKINSKELTAYTKLLLYTLNIIKMLR